MVESYAIIVVFAKIVVEKMQKLWIVLAVSIVLSQANGKNIFAVIVAHHSVT